MVTFCLLRVVSFSVLPTSRCSLTSAARSPYVTAAAASVTAVEGCSLTLSEGSLSIYVLLLHSLRELCLAHVIGDMRGSAEQNGEPIAMRLTQEILFRYSTMLL